MPQRESRLALQTEARGSKHGEGPSLIALCVITARAPAIREPWPVTPPPGGGGGTRFVRSEVAHPVTVHGLLPGDKSRASTQGGKRENSSPCLRWPGIDVRYRGFLARRISPFRIRSFIYAVIPLDPHGLVAL